MLQVPASAPVVSMPTRQLVLDLDPGLSHGLDTFVPGANGELLTWLRAWPQLATPGSPTYLWGAAGSGKTHLLAGLARQARAQGWHGLRLDARGFQSWEGERADGATLVLIDDCQCLDEQQQHWAFQLFLEMAASLTTPEASPVALVAAGAMPVVDLPVRDDLRTRLGWGLSFAVQPLDDAGLRTILAQEARRRGIPMADAVLAYVLTHFDRNPARLVDLLERLDRYALGCQRPVTVPLLKQMLADPAVE